MGRRENLNYSVAPRYTAGSPGLVDAVTGQTVAAEEKRAYSRHLEGMYGEEEKARATAAGLEGIVYIVTEKGGNMHIRDVITEQFFKVPTKLWGAQAPDGQSRWHSRTDRKQFRVDPETLKTSFERRGKRYIPVVPPKFNDHEHTRKFSVSGEGNLHLCRVCAPMKQAQGKSLGVPTDAMGTMMGLTPWPTGKEACDVCGSKPA